MDFAPTFSGWPFRFKEEEVADLEGVFFLDVFMLAKVVFLVVEVD